MCGSASADQTVVLTSPKWRIANRFNHQPFVGNSAFAHKGQVHVSTPSSLFPPCEHMEPELVGNGQHSDHGLGGRSNIVSLAARRFGFHLDRTSPWSGLFNELKKKANLWCDYASAEASVELLILHKLARRGVRTSN